MTQNKKPSLAEIAGSRPAFPALMPTSIVSDRVVGMTMRQYYAAAVLNGVISGYSSGHQGCPLIIENVAKKAFEIADAMIKAEIQNDPQA